MGNGTCDDGSTGPDLRCPEFSWDGSDCEPTIDTGTSEDSGTADTGVPPDPDPDPDLTGPFDENLVENPGLETGDLTGWTTLSSGGAGFDVSAGGHTGDYSLRTSYGLSEREQTIDLIATGFSESSLDAAPEVAVSEWFKEIYAGGDTYVFVVDLKDASGAIITTFDGSGTTTGVTGYDDDDWFEVSHSFTGYGSGLRSITIRDGGRDSESWSGHYGVKLDDAAVVLVLP
jgi:F-box protein 2